MTPAERRAAKSGEKKGKESVARSVPPADCRQR